MEKGISLYLSCLGSVLDSVSEFVNHDFMTFVAIETFEYAVQSGTRLSSFI